MVGIGIFREKKSVVRKDKRRSYIIYFNGNAHVVSFKFPEQLVYEVDRYVAKIGLRNRSNLLRLLLLAFLKNMKIAEKNGLLEEASRRDIKITLVIEFGDYQVSQVIDLESFISGYPGLISISEDKKDK